MRTVYHPTIPGLSYDVADAEAPTWKAAGWRYTAPDTAPNTSTDSTTATAPAAGDSTTTDKEND